jgi:glyoxylase-like metal-dependent hydrolase (beta-lactamase superfamily II)
MDRLASGISYVDLMFRSTPRIVATAVIQGPRGVALLDPGPTSTLPVLLGELERGGIGVGDLTEIVLTHIHLDHAGATGTLVRRNPALKVFVHEKGAPHMVDPAKLLASAGRLYGDQMETLWGEVAPVPNSALTSLAGGERIEAGGRRFDVAYTPGHASHHVSYFNADTGLAFVGDTAGIKRTATGMVLAPTPPPDIDLESWETSVAKIEAWRPDTLFITHFGPASPSAPHLNELREHLRFMTAIVRESLTREGTDEDREAWFTEKVRLELRRRMNDADAHAYEVAGRFDLNWRGLARYLRKKAG